MSSHQSNFKNSINYLIGLIILTLCVAYYSEHNWVQGNHNQEAVNEQSMATILAKLKTEPQSDKLINLFTYQNEYIKSQENMVLSLFSVVKTVLGIVLIWLVFHQLVLSRQLKV